MSNDEYNKSQKSISIRSFVESYKKGDLPEEDLTRMTEALFDLVGMGRSDHYIEPPKGWYALSKCKEHGKPFICYACKGLFCETCNSNYNFFDREGKQIFECAKCNNARHHRMAEERRAAAQKRKLEAEKRSKIRKEKFTVFFKKVKNIFVKPVVWFKYKLGFGIKKPTTF